jgi:DNA-binding NtrC family response regulator
VTRVGSSRELPVDVRVVVATHRDLLAATRAGTFREDLYYRVSASTVRVPPLRERRVEIPLLADSFARRFAARLGRPAPVLHAAVARLLAIHDWPGNVRELKNAIEHAVALSDGPVVRPEHLPETLRASRASGSGRAPSALRDTVASAERKAIVEALAKTGGNRTHAARALGMPRRTLVYKLAKYGIGREA